MGWGFSLQNQGMNKYFSLGTGFSNFFPGYNPFGENPDGVGADAYSGYKLQFGMYFDPTQGRIFLQNIAVMPPPYFGCNGFFPYLEGYIGGIFSGLTVPDDVINPVSTGGASSTISGYLFRKADFNPSLPPYPYYSTGNDNANRPYANLLKVEISLHE
jgi:hypothetical protein